MSLVVPLSQLRSSQCSVEEHIGVLVWDRVSPQRLGDVLHPVHPAPRRNTSPAAPSRPRSPALVALDDRRLERQTGPLGHLQRDLARPSLELPLVVAGTNVHSVGSVLVSLGATEPVGSRLKQGVER